ncbi:MAG TPA: type III-B CRISPR module RAMP protein Cmr1 [Ktedonobacteraceae bacterium]
MQEVTFTLQTVTPLFLAGADYNSIHIPEKKQQGRKYFVKDGWDLQPEVRPSSFRGLMRYWLRASISGLAATTDVSLNDVIEFERNIFGATDHGSAITVQLANVPKTAKRFKKEGYNQATMTGGDYLLWSMAESGKGEDYKPDRLCFPAGTDFEITLSERFSDPAAPQKLPYAIASMWLLTHLGGIGSRSRRCAGSLMALHARGNVTNLPFVTAANKVELQAILHQGITEIYKLAAIYSQSLGKQSGNVPLKTPSFDSLSLLHNGGSLSSPHGCRIWLLTQNNSVPWQSPKAAMDHLGSELQAYRSRLLPQERATFGLPLNIRLSAQESELEAALKNNRRASPLLLRLTKLSSGGYVCIAVLFKTPFTPIFDKSNKKILIPAPNYTVIENWIDTFQSRLEVML